MNQEQRRRRSRLCAIGVACVIAFTLYGSYVPFNLTIISPAEALARFREIAAAGFELDSRSDFAANMLLGFPLGFLLLGALPGESKFQALRNAALIWPVCIFFAGTVEFFQLYFPGRQCSIADIAAQSIGSGLGLTVWFFLGEPIARFFEFCERHELFGGKSGRFAVLYLILLTLIHLLPLDFDVSPASVYHKLRDHTEWIPFAEWTRTSAEPWVPFRKLLRTLGMGMPLGWLCAGIPLFRNSILRFAGLGFAVGLIFESGQEFVSRDPSATDVICMGWAIVLGGLTARLGHDRKFIVIGSVMWIAGLAVIRWIPFHFEKEPVSFYYMVWIPMMDLAMRQYQRALDDFLTNIIFFAPLGMTVAKLKGGMHGALLLALATAGSIELGVLFLPDQTPSVTRLLEAILGCAAGFRVVKQFRDDENS